MKLEIWKDEARTGEVALEDGEHTVGGEGAKVVLPGETGVRARLWVESGRVSVDADSALRVGGLQLPARMRRLVLPGERIELGAFVLVPVGSAQDEQPATRALAFDLLGGEPEVETPVQLTCLTGTDAGRRFAIGDVAMEIGRGEQAAIRLRDRAVSRRHARVLREGGQYVLEELDTPNGIYVNGARVCRRAVLEGGELIEIGQSLLRFTAPPPAEDRASAPIAGGSKDSGSDPRAVTSGASAKPGAVAQEVPSDVSANGEAPAAVADAAADPGRDAPPRRRGDWLLIAVGILVFGAGLVVSASCLEGGPFPGLFTHAPASAGQPSRTASSRPSGTVSSPERPDERNAPAGSVPAAIPTPAVEATLPRSVIAPHHRRSSRSHPARTTR